MLSKLKIATKTLRWGKSQKCANRPAGTASLLCKNGISKAVPTFCERDEFSELGRVSDAMFSWVAAQYHGTSCAGRQDEERWYRHSCFMRHQPDIHTCFRKTGLFHRALWHDCSQTCISLKSSQTFTSSVTHTMPHMQLLTILKGQQLLARHHLALTGWRT